MNLAGLEWGSITTSDADLQYANSTITVPWTTDQSGIYSTGTTVTFDTSPNYTTFTPPVGPESPLEWLDRRVREVTRAAWN